MSEQQIVMAFFFLYLNTVVGRLAYVLGQERGAEDERKFRKSFLGVGTIWRVGDDGRLYQVKGTIWRVGDDGRLYQVKEEA